MSSSEYFLHLHTFFKLQTSLQSRLLWVCLWQVPTTWYELYVYLIKGKLITLIGLLSYADWQIIEQDVLWSAKKTFQIKIDSLNPYWNYVAEVTPQNLNLKVISGWNDAITLFAAAKKHCSKLSDAKPPHGLDHTRLNSCAHNTNVTTHNAAGWR